MVQIAHYYSQQTVEVVRDATGELSDRLHFLGLTKLFFGRLFLRDVARDLRETQQAANRIANGVNYDACHEGGSVLTTAPTLRFVFSGPLCCCEGRLRQSVSALVFGIEAREVLTQNFGR